MRILITSIVDLKKTSHNRLHEFIKHLRKTHDITVLSINDWWKAKQTDVGLYAQGLESALGDINVQYFTLRRISPIFQEVASVVTIGRILGRIDYKSFDVHLNYSSLVSGYFVAKKMRRVGVATIYDIADDLPAMIRVSPQIPAPARPLGRLFGDFMLKRNIEIATKVSFVDTHIRDLYPAPEDKEVIIPNGVDVELFYPYPSQSLREELGIGRDFVIGFVGTMREWVDFEPVFAAVGQLSSQCSDIKILIVGEEGGLSKTRHSAQRLGVLDKTIFVGTIPYNLVPQYISCMDVCLIPFAKHKGMDTGVDGFCPLKLPEYLACEKPVISTQKTPMPEYMVLYASTVEEYRDKILQLYNDPQLRKQMGLLGRKLVQSSYTWSSRALMLEEMLSEVASRKLQGARYNDN